MWHSAPSQDTVAAGCCCVSTESKGTGWEYVSGVDPGVGQAGDVPVQGKPLGRDAPGMLLPVAPIPPCPCCVAEPSHPQPMGASLSPQKAEQGDFLGRLSCLNASYMIYLFIHVGVLNVN